MILSLIYDLIFTCVDPIWIRIQQLCGGCSWSWEHMTSALFCVVQIVLESGEDDSPPGLIMPSGEINWNCPCLGGMAVGPCGVDFR